MQQLPWQHPAPSSCQQVSCIKSISAMLIGDTLLWMFCLRPDLVRSTETGFSTHQGWISFINSSEVRRMSIKINVWQVFPAVYQKKKQKPFTFCHMALHLKGTFKHRIYYHTSTGKCSPGPGSESCLGDSKCFTPSSSTFSIWMATASSSLSRRHSQLNRYILFLKECEMPQLLLYW